MKKAYLLLCSVLSVQCSLAQGIEDSLFILETVEVSASRIFKKEEAGMKGTRVDSVILMEKINQSLSEILSGNTSVFIKDHGRGALATASFRGTAPSHTQLLWNGINVSSPMTGMVDFSLVPVFVIDDMDLKYGAASIANGTGGIGGAIQVSNRVDWDNKLGVKFMQGIGSYSTFNEYLQMAIGNTRFQSKTRLYHNYSKNDYSFVNRGIADIDPVTGEVVNPVEKNSNADYTLYGFLQEIYFRPGQKNVFSARWWWQKADRAIPRATSYEGPDNTNLNKQYDQDNKVVAEWKNFGNKYQLMLRSGYSGKKLDYSLKNNVPGLGPVPAIYSESRQNSSLNTVSFHYNLTKDFSIQTSMDVDYHDVISRDTVNHTGYDQDRSSVSWLLALRKGFAGRVNLNIMLRQDWIDFKVKPIVPYLGVDYRVIREKDLILKGNIARNYHFPSLNDLYWQPGGNPDLKPEEGITYELGLEYLIKLENHILSSELTAFRSDIENWIIWLPSYRGYWEPQNIKRVLSKGIELSLGLKGNFGKFGYKASGTYAYTSSVNYGDPLTWGDESFGKQLPYVPLHSGNLMVNLSYRGFYVTYQHNAYSERFTTSSNDITQRDWLYPYYMNDLIIGKEFKLKKTTIAAEFKIYNLFDETYHSVLYRPMPGRNYLFMLMIKYQK